MGALLWGELFAAPPLLLGSPGSSEGTRFDVEGCASLFCFLLFGCSEASSALLPEAPAAKFLQGKDL